MDYDSTAMPSSYDAGRGYSAPVLSSWLETIARWVPADTVSEILDIGCGTGRFSGALADRFSAKVFGIDPSKKMLAEAKRKGGANVFYALGVAEALPISSGAVDLIYMSMVFHHLRDTVKTIKECRRVLRPGGTLCLRAATSDQIETYAYVPFFPATREILGRTLQSKDTIVSLFDSGGFQLVGYELVPSKVGDNWSDYADKLTYRADSILVQLSEDEFQDGLSAVRMHSATTEPSESVIESVDFFAFSS